MEQTHLDDEVFDVLAAFDDDAADGPDTEPGALALPGPPPLLSWQSSPLREQV